MLMANLWTGLVRDEDGPPMEAEDWAKLSGSYCVFMTGQSAPPMWKPIRSDDDLINFMWLCQDDSERCQWGHA